jgi:aminoglycoside phosphotransferase (APT) family kinase protein
MFAISRGETRAVLRRPSGVPLEGAAEGMAREYRILSALEGTPVPHAAPIAFCDDPEVLGSVFYLMAYVPGFIPSAELPREFASNDARHALGIAVVDALAALHSVDWRERLAGFGRPDGFHERQRGRWLRQYEGYAAQELTGIEEVGDWLAQRAPTDWSPAIMHGDYHAANLLIAPEPPPRVAAICDWETATIGDPLLDLAGFLRIWFEINGDAGWPTRDELIARYAARTGRAIPDLSYYDVLARFRLAVTVEGIYQRSKSDPTRPLALDLHGYGLYLVESARAVIRPA